MKSKNMREKLFVVLVFIGCILCNLKKMIIILLTTYPNQNNRCVCDLLASQFIYEKDNVFVIC